MLSNVKNPRQGEISLNAMKMYGILPVLLQNAACNYGGRKSASSHYGELFHRFLSEYTERKSWSYARLNEFRNQRLAAMIKHCYETVPFYTALFNEYGFDCRSIKTLEDLRVLPVLNKQIVRDNYDRFISTAIPKERVTQVSTGGTTGSSFIIQTTEDTNIEKNAMWWSYRQNIGIPYGTWGGYFGYNHFVPAKQTKPPFWRICSPQKAVYFSSFHVSEANLKHYIAEINRRRLRWLHGFPSLLSLLAGYMAERGLRFDCPLTHVTTGSEHLHDYQKNIMEQAFGVTPHQHYGMTEDVANISENKDHVMYVDEDYSAVEFVPYNGGHMIVGTSLTNFAMPLLRWETNDCAQVETQPDGSRRVISLDGRSEDIITLPDGRKIGRLDHVFREAVHFKEVQIYQHKDYSITIYAVKTQDDVTADEKIGLSKLRQSIGNAVKAEFKYVDEIPRTSRNKLRFVVSEIK